MNNNQNQKLKLDQQTIELFWNQLPLGVIIADQYERLCFANNEAMCLLNIDDKNFNDQRFRDIFGNDKLSSAVDNLQSGITSRTSFEINIKQKFLKISINSMSIKLYGSSNLFFVVIEDITTFKEMKLIKTEFVSTILHKIRTPLTTIKSSLACMTALRKTKSRDTEKLFDMCVSETDRLVVFLNDMRDLFLIETGLLQANLSKTIFEIDPVIEKCLKILTLPIREKQLKINQPENLSHAIIEGDRNRVMQVILNILGNAVIFTPNNGSISIAVMSEENDLRISITDTGIGIARDDLQRIFEKHYRGDNKVTRDVIGNGLGLYIARSFVSLMGGNIYVYSELGHGSQFDIVFPG
ncbi:HAMP domain-containing histidine kinase [bacterium]|nr:HAMP domain-containing histidine kinase [bacterium]